MVKLRNRGRSARLLRKQITCADPSVHESGRAERQKQVFKQYQALSDLENHTDAGYSRGKFNLLY